MSEEKTNYMELLDSWTGENVIAPIQEAYAAESGDCDSWTRTVEQVQKAIRTKVLESYRNGQAVGPTKPRSAYKPRGK